MQAGGAKSPPTVPPYPATASCPSFAYRSAGNNYNCESLSARQWISGLHPYCGSAPWRAQSGSGSGNPQRRFPALP